MSQDKSCRGFACQRNGAPKATRSTQYVVFAPKKTVVKAVCCAGSPIDAIIVICVIGTIVVSDSSRVSVSNACQKRKK